MKGLGGLLLLKLSFNRLHLQDSCLSSCDLLLSGRSTGNTCIGGAGDPKGVSRLLPYRGTVPFVFQSMSEVLIKSQCFLLMLFK